MNKRRYKQPNSTPQPEKPNGSSESIVDEIMPEVMKRLEQILPVYICEQVLKHIDYPMGYRQAANLLDMKEDTLRKWNKRGIITFARKEGRYVTTLQELCKQIGHSVVLQRILSHH